ncbi:hypothetical protein HOLleu_09716 [Holothuria leucospilota]|uniref:Uncharacterized protein n=1 Tax=Holothuria leucospilota TaxID=206669 RepID=A0A9Q1CDR3_HOLLE|nr:hypothetical protein HOLleu_09716 [Holothuria leucospilota]
MTVRIKFEVKGCVDMGYLARSFIIRRQNSKKGRKAVILELEVWPISKRLIGPLARFGLTRPGKIIITTRKVPVTYVRTTSAKFEVTKLRLVKRTGQVVTPKV